jgi:hypothetical protein
MSMQLSLELKEQEILAWALRNTISDLGAEIADTEKPGIPRGSQGTKGGVARHSETFRSRKLAEC